MHAHRNYDEHFFMCCVKMAQGVTAKEMAVVLKFQRDRYAAGLRMPDPEVIMTAGQRDYLRGVTGA